MEVRLKLLKLLETATHDTATDGERLSALNAFRRISDKSGGIEIIFAAPSINSVLAELESHRSALRSAHAENQILRAETKELLEKLAAKTRAETIKPTSHDQSASLLLSCLKRDWQELHKLHEAVRLKGYEGDSSTTKERLNFLCSTGKAEYRDAGMHPDASGAKRWQPQSWRLKKKGWL